MSALVVRPAAAADLAARTELLRAALADFHWEAFLYFFFQELTLQCVVLCGAVLFIFCGAGAGTLAVLPVCAAALVAAAVRVHSATVAANIPHKLRGEEWGYVVEACGGLGLELGPAPGAAVPVVTQQEFREPREPREDEHGRPTHIHKQIVGTISVCRTHDGCGWWVCGVGVSRAWRRRGVGGALVGAARARAGLGGRDMHTAVSHLQGDARALLHKHGWEVRGTYHRPLLGDALVLPMAHLHLALPHA